MRESCYSYNRFATALTVLSLRRLTRYASPPRIATPPIVKPTIAPVESFFFAASDAALSSSSCSLASRNARSTPSRPVGSSIILPGSRWWAGRSEEGGAAGGATGSLAGGATGSLAGGATDWRGGGRKGVEPVGALGTLVVKLTGGSDGVLAVIGNPELIVCRELVPFCRTGDSVPFLKKSTIPEGVKLPLPLVSGVVGSKGVVDKSVGKVIDLLRKKSKFP